MLIFRQKFAIFQNVGLKIVPKFLNFSKFCLKNVIFSSKKLKIGNSGNLSKNEFLALKNVKNRKFLYFRVPKLSKIHQNFQIFVLEMSIFRLKIEN